MMVVEGRCSVRDEAMAGIRGMVELMRLVEDMGRCSLDGFGSIFIGLA